jgi:multisubunit Na+/H+ antiporter MnhC subunit
MNNIFIIDLIAVILLLVIGLYTLLVSRNLLRMLIGFEIMAKGVTLAIVSAGWLNGKAALAQTLAITAIVVEVVFIAIALAIVMLIQRKKGSLDVRKLMNLKG